MTMPCSSTNSTTGWPSPGCGCCGELDAVIDHGATGTWLRVALGKLATERVIPLLRAILNTAVKEDRLLRGESLPDARVRQRADIGAAGSVSRSGVAAICADATSVSDTGIFAAFAGLRWGELAALRARDVDLDTGVVHALPRTTSIDQRVGPSAWPSRTA
jgi:hypothetical protein